MRDVCVARWLPPLATFVDGGVAPTAQRVRVAPQGRTVAARRQRVDLVAFRELRRQRRQPLLGVRAVYGNDVLCQGAYGGELHGGAQSLARAVGQQGTGESDREAAAMWLWCHVAAMRGARQEHAAVTAPQ